MRFSWQWRSSVNDGLPRRSVHLVSDWQDLDFALSDAAGDIHTSIFWWGRRSSFRHRDEVTITYPHYYVVGRPEDTPR